MAPRLIVAVLLLALSTGCATQRVVRLDTGQGAPLEYRPPTSDKSMKVGAGAFEEALTRLVLNAPLALQPPRQGWLVRTSSSGATPGPQWHLLMRKSFGGPCKAGQPREDCVSLLEEGSLVITLAPTAVAMAAQGVGGEGAAAGVIGFRSWGSFSGLKSALGPAGEGKEWHHVVEQTPGNVERFGPHALHNTHNVTPLDTGLHRELSRLYSSIQLDITGSTRLTVRQWLSTQPYEAQRKFGLLAIENVTKGIW
jgi:hypothetical protein